MNIEAYIASGILELYALDQLNPTERAEVERNLAQYPQLRQELDEIERSLEAFAFASAQELPNSGFDAIEQQLGSTEETSDSISKSESPGQFNRWMLVGSLLLLAAAIAIALLFQKNRQLQAEKADLQAQIEACEEQARQLEDANNQIAFLQQANSQHITLAGLEAHPEAQARVVYNTAAGRTVFSPAGMPSLEQAYQYQLWAIIGDQQISLAVFDPLAPDDFELIDVTHYESVDAFAITREPAGGSETPTLEQLYVLGEV